MCSDVLICSQMFSDDHRRFWIFRKNVAKNCPKWQLSTKVEKRHVTRCYFMLCYELPKKMDRKKPSNKLLKVKRFSGCVCLRNCDWYMKGSILEICHFFRTYIYSVITFWNFFLYAECSWVLSYVTALSLFSTSQNSFSTFSSYLSARL